MIQQTQKGRQAGSRDSLNLHRAGHFHRRAFANSLGKQADRKEQTLLLGLVRYSAQAIPLLIQIGLIAAFGRESLIEPSTSDHELGKCHRAR